MPETPEMHDKPDAIARAPLAYRNDEFIDSPDGRLFRIMAEYQEPLVRFRRERIEDTVVFFGSARIGPPETAAEAGAVAGMTRYYGEARALAGMVAQWGRSLPGPRHRLVVTSGGGPGIMEAANRGAWEAGCKSIGLNIKLPHEQLPNRWITPELNFEFTYFFMRKYWFAYLAKALIVFPGGFGTMDEMFEVITLAQTHKLARQIPVILYGSEYWRTVVNFDLLAERGVISPVDLDLFHFADSPEEAFGLLQEGLAEELTAVAAAVEVPQSPALSAQDLLGPNITKTL